MFSIAVYVWEKRVLQLIIVIISEEGKVGIDLACLHSWISVGFPNSHD